MSICKRVKQEPTVLANYNSNRFVTTFCKLGRIKVYNALSLNIYNFVYLYIQLLEYIILVFRCTFKLLLHTLFNEFDFIQACVAEICQQNKILVF